MFLGNQAFEIGLIALAAGIALILWSIRNEEKRANIARICGYIIAILAIFNMLCISYYIVRYWHEGYFQTPAGISMMQNKPMGGSMMQNKPMGGGTMQGQ